MPRILFLDHTASLGGAELYLCSVARAFQASCEVVLFEDGPLVDRLRKAGVTVTVLAAPPAVLNVRRDGASPVDLLRALPGLIQLVWRLAQKAREADVVVANSQKSMFVGGLASRWAGRRFVWILHDLLSSDHFSALNRRLAVGAANLLTDRVLVNSDASRHAYGAAGGRIEDTHVVYNGIAASPFDAVTDADAVALRDELGLSNVPVVGLFSRLTHWKGQHVLVDALAKLPGVHAVLIGDALFGGDGPYVSSLREQTVALGLADRVHFLGFRDDVPTLMKACDVVVHTSVAPEPFGRVIVEGMLARRPVVAAEAGGAMEIVDDGVSGRLVPPGDADALARVLGDLLAQPDAAASLAGAGRQRAETVFSESAMIDAIRPLILEF